MDIKIISLKGYLDKSLIHSILCDYHYQFYNKLNMIAMMPLILGSSILTVLNTSTIPDDILKYLNISLNGLNTIVIALTTNYKLNDRLTTYKTLYNKYQKLSHKIENLINNSNDISERNVDDIITEYDNLQNDNNYGYLSSYKKQIIQKFKNTKQLPNSLALEQTEADLVIAVAS